MRKSIHAALAILALAATTGIAVSAIPVLAKGGGGRSSGGARSSVSRPAAPKPSTSKPSTSPRPAPKPAAPSTRPSSATKTVTAAKAKTVAGKTYSRKGSVVDSNYQPRFSGGYAPAPGATVYYRDNGIMIWLPFYMIMTNQQHREAVVTEPGKDGAPETEKVVQEEGTDTMYIVNWIVTLLFLGGLAAGIVWLVNHYSKKKR